MKAKDFTKWLIDSGLRYEDGINYVSIEEDNDEQFGTESQEEFIELFFGAEKPYRNIPGGDYVWIYDSALEKISDKEAETILKNFEIRLKTKDYKEYIYLILLED